MNAIGIFSSIFVRLVKTFVIFVERLCSGLELFQIQ